jgi:Fe-S cluster assembly scaffold protein SufB
MWVSLPRRGLDEDEAVSTIVRGFLKGQPHALEEEMERVIQETRLRIIGNLRRK